MTTYHGYNLILIGLYVGFIVLIVVISAIIGLKSTFCSFLDATFGICKVSENDKGVIFDVYGSRVNILTSRRLRIAFRILILNCFYILSLVFVDGCILSRHVLAMSGMCPATSTTDCFYLTSIFGFDSKPFYCPPNEPVASTNITAEVILCFTWELKSQSTIGILSQLGICSSILSLLGLLFKFLYFLARRKCWGILLTIAFGLVIMIIPFILWFGFHINISFIVFMLMLAALILLVDVLFLVHTVKVFSNQITIDQSTTSDSKHICP